MNGLLAYLLSKKYTNDSLSGITTLKGKNCQIQEIDDSDPTKAVITFAYYDNSDVLKTEELEVPYMNEKNIADIDATHDDTNAKTVITFTLNDGSTESFDIADGLEGNGIASITKSDTDVSHVITISYTDPTKDNTVFTFSRLTKWFSGNMIIEDFMVDTSKYIVGDLYLNTVTFDVLTPDAITGKWKLACNIKGDMGNSAYETFCELHPGATKAQFIESLSGEAINMYKVWEKPKITDPTTEVNAWYYYQANDPANSDFLESLKDTGSYLIANAVNNTSVSVSLHKDDVIFWDAWLTGKEMVLTIPQDILLYKGEQLFISYDLTGYEEDVPEEIRPENVAVINKITTVGTTETIARVTGDDITRVDADDVPSDAIYVNTLLSCTPQALKITESLAESTAWEGITNFSTTVEIPSGPVCAWDGVRYVCFTMPMSIKASDFLDTYAQGLALFCHEQRNRGWIVGKEDDDEVIILHGSGVPVTYSDKIPVGYTDISSYFTTYDYLGKWYQTIYVGQSKNDASDVTITTGSATSGSFVPLVDYNTLVKPSVTLETTNKTVTEGINELNGCVKNDGYEKGYIFGISDTDIKDGINDAQDMETALRQLYYLMKTDFHTGVGAIMAYAHDDIPTGWLECNGDAVSRTVYGKLFEKIGTTFGSGDGSTTFNLPDLRNRFVEGIASTSFTGASIAAGLPNIKGSFGGDRYGGGYTIMNDAFSSAGRDSAGSDWNGDTGQIIGFDASKGTFGANGSKISQSDSPYGKSSTVQPPAIGMVYCIFTGSAESEEVVDLFKLIDADSDHEAIAFGHKTVDDDVFYGYYKDGDTTSTLNAFVTESYVDARVREKINTMFAFDSTTGILTISL